jgi:hypothetical protein
VLSAERATNFGLWRLDAAFVQGSSHLATVMSSEC